MTSLLTLIHRRAMFAFATLTILGLSGAVRAQDAKTQEVDAGGLKFAVPSTWKSSPPTSSMRRAQLKIDPAKGDSDPAEMIVFAFPGGAGSVEANIDRWEKQFRDKDGNSPKATVKTVKTQNGEATIVEIAGHFFPPTFPGQPKQEDKENYRLLGAIVITPDVGYFLRLVGPEKTVSGVKADFDKMVGSMKTAGN